MVSAQEGAQVAATLAARFGSSLVIPRPAEFEAKLAAMRADGPARLQVIADFDHTLTACRLPDGAAGPQCHDVIEHSPLMSEEFRTVWREMMRQTIADSHAGRDRDNDMWWRKAHRMIADFGLRRDWIPEMVRSSGLRCRPGFKEFFNILDSSGIPSLIVSAGITNVILAVLEREGVAAAALPGSAPGAGRVSVVANEFFFDEGTRLLTSFTEPPIHGHSKRSVGERVPEHFRPLVSRHNVLILGDSLHDCEPLLTVPGVRESLKVGFYDGGRWGNRMSNHEEVYDVLLSNETLTNSEDVTLEPVLELLRHVMSLGSVDAPSVGESLPHQIAPKRLRRTSPPPCAAPSSPHGRLVAVKASAL